MARDHSDEAGEIVRRTFDTETADPNVSVIEVVSDLENADPGELPPLYTCIDHLLEHLFSDPPTDEADATIEFSYHNYRITVSQNGAASFEPAESGSEPSE